MVYVYYGVMKLPKGVWRLFALLPLIAFYIYMPLKLATVFERGFVSFLFTWLTTFKLLLLCWDAGPAADPWAFSTFPRFLAVISLSLQLKTKSASQARAAGLWHIVLLRLFLKFLFLVLLSSIYTFRTQLPGWLIYMMYSFQIYVSCSLVFDGLATIVSAATGIELEPAYNKPFLSSSLTDFWGKRWNLLISNLMRTAVYEPRFSQVPLWPRTLALFSCFVVSGLMHELLFVYISLSWPTGEATAFFTLHGILAALELFIRRRFRLKVTKLVSIPITLCFLFFSSIWLFYPALFRAGTEEQAMAEFQHFFCKFLPENSCS
ncbi:unnamed protein product [Sphagnum balticum]